MRLQICICLCFFECDFEPLIVSMCVAPVSAVPLTEEERVVVWDELSDDLSSLLRGNGQLPSGAMPFDAASSEDVEQQR